MATSEPLVETGQPYGQRQETRAAMRRADIPLAPRSTNGATSSPASSQRGIPTAGGPAGGIRGPLALLGDTSPGDFPFLTDAAAEPSAQPASEPDSIINALAGSAQSSFAQAVMRILEVNTGRGAPGFVDRITEDDPRFNPRTMGNRRRGMTGTPEAAGPR